MQADILKGPQFENVVDQHGVLSTFISTSKKAKIQENGF